MNKEKDKLEKALSQISFRELSGEEMNLGWQKIATGQSPTLLALIIRRKIMFASIIVTLVLALGIGGTVVTADNASPGDTLFGVDRAVENLRLRLASNEKKNELRIRFADERVREVEKISRKEESSEADVSLRLSIRDKENVTLGVNVALDLLDDISDSLNEEETAKMELIAEKLNKYLEDLPEDVRIDLRVDTEKDRARLDLRSEEGRIRVKIKDGEIKIKEKEGEDRDGDGRREESDDDGDDEDKDENRSGRSGDDDRDEEEGDDSREDSENALEIEADVFTNETVVKIERQDKKSSFTTPAKTRVGIISAIRAKFPELTEAEIEAVLEIELEDRPSRIQDLTDLLD
jgi:hypothetical protein